MLLAPSSPASLYIPTGSTPFPEPQCDPALISPGAVPKAITDRETKRIHFIVYKTTAPVGRNTIITLTAANGVGVGGKSSFQILENHSVKMELLGTWVLDLNPVSIPSPPTFLISSLVFLISHSPECRGYLIKEVGQGAQVSKVRKDLGLQTVYSGS